MNLEEIRRLLDQYRSRLSELTGELEAMPSGDDLTDDHRTRAAEIHQVLRTAHTDGAERGLLDEIRELERMEDTLVRAQDAVQRGSRDVEPGDDRRSVNVNTRTSDDPYDLTSLRTSPTVDGPEAHGAELRGRARAAIERTAFRADIGRSEDEQREHVTRLLERIDTSDGAFARHLLATGSDDYDRAYGRRLLGQPLSGDDQRALERAMTIGTGSEGGHAVMPFTLDPTVILSSDGSVNPLRQVARVEQGVTNQWKGVSSAGMTVGYAAEAAQAGDNSPSLDDPTVDAHRAQAFVPFSIELDQDWSALRSQLTRLAQDGRDDLEAEKFILGSGNGEPQGLVSGLGASQTVNTETAGTFAAEDLYALEEALGPRFRARARFLGNKAVYNDVRQFDTQGGADLWVRLGAGQPGELIGYPAHEASAMDGDSSDSGGNILALGDTTHYLIYDRVGMAVELIPHLFGADRRPTGQRGVYFFWRNGGGILVANAFRRLQVAA